MFVPVNFKLGDQTLYSRVLSGLASRARDLTVPFKRIGGLLIANIGQQFASEGAWASTPWKPLTDAYAAWKEEHYPGRPLLVASGAMRGDLLDAGRSLKITPTRLVYTPPDRTITRTTKKGLARAYNPAEIAFYHQTGAGHNPPRPIVSLPLAELREIDRIFLDWLNARELIGH